MMKETYSIEEIRQDKNKLLKATKQKDLLTMPCKSIVAVKNYPSEEKCFDFCIQTIQKAVQKHKKNKFSL